MATDMTSQGIYALFDHIPDGVCLADDVGNVIYMNEAATRLLQLSKPQHHLRNICELLCEKLETQAGVKAGAGCPLREACGQAQSVTFVGRHGPHTGYNWRDDKINRAQNWADLRVRCVRAKRPLPGHESEEIHMVLIEDARDEMELKRHRQDWRSMIAHDLRSPLTNIYSALKLLEEIHPRQSAETSEEDSKLIGVSLRSCARMIELLDLYLDVARFDAGAMPVKLEEVDVSGVIADAVEEQSALASSKGVLIEMDLDPGLRVAADAGLLPRVVQNLVNNGIKYNLQGGTLKISATSSDGNVQLSFKDTGIGIESKDLPLIFDRFYQAQARRAGRIKGNGLGLTFCKEALGLMEGEISVQSQPGQGTEFTVRLKAAIRRSDDERANRSGPRAQAI